LIFYVISILSSQVYIKVMSKLFITPVLVIVFYAVILPIGLVLRIFQKDLLKLKKREISSYWIGRPKKDRHSFEN